MEQERQPASIFALNGSEKVELWMVGPEESILTDPLNHREIRSPDEIKRPGAKDMIARMKNIRRFNRGWSDDYCRIRMAGKWGLSNDAIVIDKHGNTRNAQHRLDMVIRTGLPAPFIVLQGVEKEVDMTCDQEHRRSAGLLLEKSNSFIGAIKGFYGYPLQVRDPWPPSRIEEAITIVGSHVEDIMRLVGEAKPLSGSPVWSAFSRAACYVDRDILVNLLAVMRGEDAPPNPASPAIRRMIQNISPSFSSSTFSVRTDTYCKFQTAIKAFALKKKQDFIRGAMEDYFPVPACYTLSEWKIPSNKNGTEEV